MDSAGKSSPDLNRDPVAGYRANGIRQASVPVRRPPPLAPPARSVTVSVTLQSGARMECRRSAGKSGDSAPPTPGFSSRCAMAA